MLDLQRLAGNGRGPVRRDGAAPARPGVRPRGTGRARREAPHEHGPGCGHGAVEATGPTAQRSLLDAARNTPSICLGAFLAKAKPSFQNDRPPRGAHGEPHSPARHSGAGRRGHDGRQAHLPRPEGRR
ncbi:hypothetical protein LV779_07010 [Streptomyces thinghirensis]|nr:hypothetical protein [Streptomyces thinghirensis]